jgi:hypothetical protein
MTAEWNVLESEATNKSATALYVLLQSGSSTYPLEPIGYFMDPRILGCVQTAHEKISILACNAVTWQNWYPHLYETLRQAMYV